MLDGIMGVASWRGLRWFWLGVLALCAAAGGSAQFLGPKPHPAAALQAPAAPPHAAPHAPPAEPAHTAPASPHGTEPHAPEPSPPPQASPEPPRAAGSPIPGPDPALLEHADGTDALLPRIGANGRQPRRAYAAGWDPADPRKRVAILLGDIGLSTHYTDDAITHLPPAVSLAVSPYAELKPDLLARIRASGHEMLIALPMEPNSYGIADPGPRALLTSATLDQNLAQLQRALGDISGYVGVTGALGALHGERFASSAQMTDVLTVLANRGLLYIDPRPASTLPAVTSAIASRAVDVVLDDRAAVRAEIDARLGRLADRATQFGTALGLASAPTPVLLDRLAAWSATLADRNLVLVPVSALTKSPAKPAATP